ncbi:MAG: AtpZ/AtpI family protein [Alphaproteobacteria bacterium]
MRIAQDRLARDQEKDAPSTGPTSDTGRGLNAALRMGTDFVAAVVVGAGIGWILDGWIGTWPIFFLIFFLFGVAAGFMNMIRTANRLGVGSTPPPE